MEVSGQGHVPAALPLMQKPYIVPNSFKSVRKNYKDAWTDTAASLQIRQEGSAHKNNTRFTLRFIRQHGVTFTLVSC